MRELACDAILFDMDGVLVDSGAVVRRVWDRWAEERGYDLETVLSTAHGHRTEDTLREIAPGLDLSAELQWLDEAELDDPEGIVAIPGASELVASLPDKQWAVVTSAGRELASRRLEWAGLPMPSILVSADDVAQGKPHPEGYLRACALLATKPSDCVVFEDSPAGVEAARAAGIRVVGLTTTHDGGALGPVEALILDLVGIEVRRAGAKRVLLRVQRLDPLEHLG